MMALTSTMYTFDVALSDADRGVYESLTIETACHPLAATACTAPWNG